MNFTKEEAEYRRHWLHEVKTSAVNSEVKKIFIYLFERKTTGLKIHV